MKDFNELVPINKIGFNLGKTEMPELEFKIYDKLFKEVMDKYISIDENVKEFEILDIFCSMSYVKDCLNDKKVKYTGLDVVSNPTRNGEIIKPDVVSDVNNLPFNDNVFDFIFAPGNKFGFGRNHESLFEVERVMQNNGFLIVSLPKFWFYNGFNQMLFCYRNWKYLEAIEINYSFIDNNEKLIKTSKFFLIYKFKG